MSTTPRSTPDLDDAVSPIRALRSLRDPQAECIIAGLSSLASEWTIERHESCDGFLSIVLHQQGGDATIIVNQDGLGMRVDLMVDDDLRPGSQAYTMNGDVVQAVAALAGRLKPDTHRHSA